MSASNRRNEIRVSPSMTFSPMCCELHIDDEKISIEIINYHFRGACLKVPVGDFRIQSKKAYLKFKIGNREIEEKIQFRIAWESISENGTLGVEFFQESSYVLSRAERFLTHSINAPVISSPDPLDPNRLIYFKVLNASTTGMLLSTSLSNRHLFPGMELKNASLTIPGIGETKVLLFIENSRPSENNTVLFGVSVKGYTQYYQDMISKYLSALGDQNSKEDRIEKLSRAGLMVKELKSALTIKEVTTEEEYKKVLKIRFDGYGKAGKVRNGAQLEDMGEGLQNEGLILAAYLGAQMVGSVELRYTGQHPLRLEEKFDFKTHPYLSKHQFVEMNKLVVVPTAQRTDVVLGIFQKIHAVTILNGKQDGLLVAEDKLVALYERLGAQKVGLSYPHPTKANTSLNVMCIPRATYEKSDKMNPLAWSQVYSNTHEFFAELGISESKRFSFKEKVLVAFSRFALKLQSRFKNRYKSKSQEAQSPNPSVPAGETKTRTVIDPRWTLQHLHASVLLPYLLVADEMAGQDEINKILLKYNFARDYFSSSSNWISIDFFNEFIEEFKKHGDVNELQEKAGYKNLSREVLGVNHFLLKHFLSPRAAFRAISSYLPKFNKTRTYEVIESSPTHCRIRIGVLSKEFIPKDKSARLNWRAVLDGHILAITGKHGKIEQLKSIFDGDEYCEYVVHWKNPLWSFKNASLAAMVSVLAVQFWRWGVAHLSFVTALQSFLILILLGVSSLLGIQFFRKTKRYNEIVDSLSEFQKDADERYRELQGSKSLLEKNYQEGKLLETISREIQTSDNLDLILNNALKALCTNFDLERAFTMTVDSSGQYLQTSATFGAGASATDLWDFKVSLDARKSNPLLISSIYKSGQSILVSNVEEHKFHLNEASRRLIDKLQTKGFAIVPIPSESKNWGVLVVDKGSSPHIITRRDLVAVQRVAQSIGMALDKKAKIESEVHVRKIFQKYVPSSIVQETLGSAGPKLGGQSKEAICLFLDIRNFTTLSNQMPPEILCDILNQVFNIVNLNVTKSRGIIDKYLGDGALATWGAIPGSESTPSEVLQTAQAILADLEIMNKALAEKGIKAIEVGIGIHKGPVIAGNIGSQDRMEFTVIGQTVNIASRLEQLTKFFKCQIVISENLIAFSELSPEWKVHSEVQVRGLEKLIQVAALTIQSETDMEALGASQAVVTTASGDSEENSNKDRIPA